LGFSVQPNDNGKSFLVNPFLLQKSIQLEIKTDLIQLRGRLRHIQRREGGNDFVTIKKRDNEKNGCRKSLKIA